ncbi:cation:proton antiporter [Streptomyces sp. TRM 70351]|uniref:cation:proton antiporter domain-containing protein n=1 Tax=Streptomyces sp. TRM 70351 TaxID=3116552 RepID=UPI002E7B40F8|nr:cation:proton antiporter [Streptomyces sp. TRM 70351]MEE1926976.1 cation:proton antiporter [Streptomyces sp. TRM 70351]
MFVDIFLTTVGALALLVAAFSAFIPRLPLSGPLVALAVGVLIGPAVLGVIDLPTVVEGHREVHEISRVLLAVSVMAVALRYPFRTARTRLKPVLLLLAVAMPVMALCTAGVSAAFLGVGLGTAALLGAALCPTDPVLASSVVTGGPAERSIPARTRQVLSLESGSNDGLALPLVLVALAVAGPMSGAEALGESLWQVFGALAVGALLGWAAGRAVRRGEDTGSMESGPLLVFTLLLALFTLGVAGLLHADGVLAVFVSGLVFNATSPAGERMDENKVDEAVNRFVVLPLFVVLGAMLPWTQWRELGPGAVLFVLGVLLLRRLPVLLLLKRPLALRWRDAVFLGWFGPVGVSALLYLTMEAHRLGADPVVLAAGTLAVAASTLAHGVSSSAGRVWYRKAAEREKEAHG